MERISIYTKNDLEIERSIQLPNCELTKIDGKKAKTKTKEDLTGDPEEINTKVAKAKVRMWLPD